MKRWKFIAPLVLALALPALAADVFDFIPVGGRTILARVQSAKAPAQEAQGLTGAKRSSTEWKQYIEQHRKSHPGLQKLTDKEAATLADYLAYNAPLASGKALPPDGRDFALNYCQGCHIITVVVTQDRPREQWLGTMNKPSHVQIKLSKEQREALAAYLVVNAAIPIDLVPEDLRAGGASY